MKNWQQWLHDLARLEEFSVNRFSKAIGFGDASSCELHRLSDASQVGYGAVTYLRFVNESSQIHCDVKGKGRFPEEDYYTPIVTICCHCLCQT